MSAELTKDELERFMASMDDIGFFLTVAALMRKPSSNNLNAARALLVDGMPPGEAAEKFGVHPGSLARLVRLISENHPLVMKELGLVSHTYTTSPAVALMIRLFQSQDLAPIIEKAIAKLARSKSPDAKTLVELAEALLEALRAHTSRFAEPAPFTSEIKKTKKARK